MSAVDALLHEARARLIRLEPQVAARAIRDGALLVDIRPEDQRRAEGGVPGAVAVERNVLEWRLDASSPFHLPHLTGQDQVVILLCSEGYASSLAAATLQGMGLVHATDVVGGFHAWRRCGLPVLPARPRTDSDSHLLTAAGVDDRVRASLRSRRRPRLHAW
jgi:rhodanese-related sulfurtransferase